MKTSENWKKGVGALAGVAMTVTLAVAVPPAFAAGDDAANDVGTTQTTAPSQTDDTTTTDQQSAEPATPQAEDQDVQQTSPETTEQEQSAPQATAAVATVGDNAYATLKDAIDAAKTGDTVTLTANSAETVTVSKQLDIKSAENVVFTGTITLAKGADGSTVSGFHFELPTNIYTNTTAGSQTKNSVEVSGAKNVTVSDNTFDYPSALYRGKEWQRNGVWVDSKTTDLTVSGNTFILGTLNDTNGEGETAVDSNANTGINLIANSGVENVLIENNTVTVSDRAQDVTRDASVYLLTAFGAKNVTVKGNTFDGNNQGKTALAGIAGLDGATFENNTVKNAAFGVTQTSWAGYSPENKNVSVKNTVFTNVQNQFTAQLPEESIGAFLLKADGSLTSYDWIVNAVNAVNNGDDSFEGATVYFNKDVDNHSVYTFKKKVTVAPKDVSVTFNGSIRLTKSGSKVTGIKFVYDRYSPKGFTANVIVGSGADDVTVSENRFTVDPGIDDAIQPNSVWIEGAAKNTVVDGNVFDLYASKNVSVVGVALTGWGAKNQMSGTKITNNYVRMRAKEGVSSDDGFNLFIKAFGAGDTAKNEFGIKDLTVSGNDFNSSQPAGVGNFLGLSNVDGVTLADNTVKNTTYGVFNVNYQGKTEPNTKITVNGGTFENVTYTVRAQTTQGVDYQKAPVFTFTDVSGFRGDTKKAPEVPSGQVFVGWYKDQNLTEALGENDTTGQAYAKFVPKSELYQYNGNTLDQRLGTDGNVTYEKSGLRFGYKLTLAQDNLTFDKSNTKWVYGLTADKDGLKYSTQTRNTVTNADGSISANLVFTVPAKYYALNRFVKFQFAYKTADGTPVTVSEDAPQSGTVKATAESTLKNDPANAYAKGLIDAYNATQTEADK